MIQGGGVLINKGKVESENRNLDSADTIKGKYILAQKRQEELFLVVLK